jgi:hypothetical protein
VLRGSEGRARGFTTLLALSELPAVFFNGGQKLQIQTQSQLTQLEDTPWNPG